jgi:hypothetical protein
LIGEINAKLAAAARADKLLPLGRAVGNRLRSGERFARSSESFKEVPRTSDTSLFG